MRGWIKHTCDVLDYKRHRYLKHEDHRCDDGRDYRHVYHALEIKLFLLVAAVLKEHNAYGVQQYTKRYIAERGEEYCILAVDRGYDGYAHEAEV